MGKQTSLSRRERQIMDIIFRMGKATVTEVLNAMTDPPDRSSVRTLMRILEEKGHLKHRKNGQEYIYRPTAGRKQVGRSALQRVISTFFDDSFDQAVAAHLSDPNAKLTNQQRRRLTDLINEAKQQEK